MAYSLVGRSAPMAADDSDDDELLARPGLAGVLRAGLVRFHDDADERAIAPTTDGVVAGVGVRARRAFARGDFVCPYWGVLVAAGSGDMPAASRAYALAANAEYELDPLSPLEDGGYDDDERWRAVGGRLNHSCAPRLVAASRG